MEQKIDITSTVVEKSIDGAKNFLEKLIMPAVEETGLLLKDKVASWRFNNQVKMLNKAKSYCTKNNISPKNISLKLLYPLLENASLEENDKLQDKWAILLSNMVDSEQNIENHVLPYLLSQISIDEFEVIEATLKQKLQKIAKINLELAELISERKNYEDKIRDEINSIKAAIDEQLEKNFYSKEYRQKNQLESPILKSKYKESELKKLLISHTFLISELEEYQISNLIRLGIIKIIYTLITNVEPSMEQDEEGNTFGMSNVEVSVDIDETQEKYVLTKLGALFVKTCTEKSSQTAIMASPNSH